MNDDKHTFIDSLSSIIADGQKRPDVKAFKVYWNRRFNSDVHDSVIKTNAASFSEAFNALTAAYRLALEEIVGESLVFYVTLLRSACDSLLVGEIVDNILKTKMYLIESNIFEEWMYGNSGDTVNILSDFFVEFKLPGVEREDTLNFRSNPSLQSSFKLSLSIKQLESSRETSAEIVPSENMRKLLQLTAPFFNKALFIAVHGLDAFNERTEQVLSTLGQSVN